MGFKHSPALHRALFRLLRENHEAGRYWRVYLEIRTQPVNISIEQPNILRLDLPCDPCTRS